jgi:hypothetical protein
VDGVSEYTCPKVVTPKTTVKFGIPSPFIKDQGELGNEGLFCDMMDNIIYLGNAQVSGGCDYDSTVTN